MPKRKERALLYVRESDITLAMDSTTIESAIKALLDHASQKGYDVSPEHIFREAISGYYTYYFDRPKLMEALKVSERHEVDVFLITEIRALSRRGAGEVLVIYNILQKANVRLETLSESITDDPMGEVLLSFRATWARIEREQSYVRMQRGKKDRIEIGNAPPNGKRAYGFILVDTEKETSARYEYNTEVIHIDQTGKQWSEIAVRTFILESLLNGATLRGLAKYLNDLGIPPPRKPVKQQGNGAWIATTIRNMVAESINYGEVWVNKYQRLNGKMVKRPREEWIKLPDGIAPALIDKKTHEAIMRSLWEKRVESLRNNKHPDELGLLRGGYIFCGICGRRMSVRYGGSGGRNRKLKPPYYRCIRIEAHTMGEFHNHRNKIALSVIDSLVKEKILEALHHHDEVRKQVQRIRASYHRPLSQSEFEETIANIRQKMQNIYRLAENATDDETILHLGERMKELETQKRETEKLLYVLEDSEEEQAAIEEELQKFEAWVDEVQPFLTDRSYMAQASYAELRFAIKILGIRVTIYPDHGDYPYRYRIDVTVPEVLAKMNIMSQSRA